jgi:hypothetical protein
MSNHPQFVVRMRIDPQYEAEFNRWYNHEYLDTLRPLAPLFINCFRQVSGEGQDKVYMTVYEIKDEESIEAALAVFDRPDRQEHRRQWKEWEKKAVKDIDARVFRPHYAWE